MKIFLKNLFYTLYIVLVGLLTFYVVWMDSELKILKG